MVGGRGGVRVAGVSATVRVRVGASCAGVRAGVMAGLKVGFALSSGSCSGFVLSSGLQVTSLGLGSGSGVGVGFVLCCAVLGSPGHRRAP